MAVEEEATAVIPGQLVSRVVKGADFPFDSPGSLVFSVVCSLEGEAGKEEVHHFLAPDVEGRNLWVTCIEGMMGGASCAEEIINDMSKEEGGADNCKKEDPFAMLGIEDPMNVSLQELGVSYQMEWNKRVLGLGIDKDDKDGTDEKEEEKDVHNTKLEMGTILSKAHEECCLILYKREQERKQQQQHRDNHHLLHKSTPFDPPPSSPRLGAVPSFVNGGEEKKSERPSLDSFLGELNNMTPQDSIRDLIIDSNQTTIPLDTPCSGNEEEEEDQEGGWSIDIIDNRMCRAGGESHVQYTISLTDLDAKVDSEGTPAPAPYNIYRRFSDFHRLYKALLGLDYRVRLLTFPSLLCLRASVSVRGERQESLQDISRRLYKILRQRAKERGEDREGRYGRIVRTFFEIPPSDVGYHVTVGWFETGKDNAITYYAVRVKWRAGWKNGSGCDCDCDGDGETEGGERSCHRSDECQFDEDHGTFTVMKRYSQFRQLRDSSMRISDQSGAPFPSKIFDPRMSRRQNLRKRRGMLERWLVGVSCVWRKDEGREKLEEWLGIKGLAGEEYTTLDADPGSTSVEGANLPGVEKSKGAHTKEDFANFTMDHSFVNGSSTGLTSGSSTVSEATSGHVVPSETTSTPATETSAPAKKTSQPSKKKSKRVSNPRSSSLAESISRLKEGCSLRGEDGERAVRSELQSMLYYPPPASERAEKELIPSLLRCVLTYPTGHSSDKGQRNYSNVPTVVTRLLHKQLPMEEAMKEDLLILGGVQILCYVLKTEFKEREIVKDAVELLMVLKKYDEERFVEVMPRFANGYFKDAKVLFGPSEKVQQWLGILRMEAG